MLLVLAEVVKNLKNVTVNKIKKMKELLLNLFFLILIINLTSCKIYNIIPNNSDIPKENFDIKLLPEDPDYSKIECWVEHPKKKNHYAKLPKNYSDTTEKKTTNIDVFFIHPTLYLKGDNWNADINNKRLNKQIGNTAIRNQASVFLGIAEIYAPHYRQMHIQSYYDLKNGLQAFDIAYSDVKNAFLYYWKHYNKGKQFIIAGHSQGTNHAERLLKDIILKNDSMKQLTVISYLPGMPIKKFHNDFPECSAPDQLNCFLSWRTLAEGFFPKDWEISDSISCVNPISWKTDNLLSNNNDHLGILFKNHKIYYPNSLEAYNHNGVVWIKPIKIPFANLYKMKNYHIADYNLYWLNIRQNLKYRLKK